MNNKQRKRVRQKRQKQLEKQIDDKTTYKKIKDFVDLHFPNSTIDCCYNEETKFNDFKFEYDNNHSAILSFNGDSKWSDIKRTLAKTKDSIKYNEHECLVCYENGCTIVRCNICAFSCCVECHVELLERNNGFDICPQCKHSIDKREIYEQMMMMKRADPLLFAACMRQFYA